MSDFSNFTDVINFIRNKNPARHKFPPRFERNVGHRKNTDLEWCLIVSRTASQLSRLSETKPHAVKYFKAFYLSPVKVSADELAKDAGRSKRTIYNWIDYVRETLIDDYCAHGILPRDYKD